MNDSKGEDAVAMNVETNQPSTSKNTPDIKGAVPKTSTPKNKKEKNLRDAEKILEKVKICQICKKELKNPERLKCFHSFCRKCLQNKLKLIREIEERENLERTGRRTSEKNFLEKLGSLIGGAKIEDEGEAGWKCLICGMITFYNRNKKLEADNLLKKLLKPFCGFCEENRNDEKLKFCRECKMIICDECERPHRNTPETKSHGLYGLKDSKDLLIPLDEVHKCYSKKHSSPQDITRYCWSCDMFICDFCFFSHKNERCNMYETKDLWARLQYSLKNINPKLEKVDMRVSSIEEQIQNVKKNYKNWRDSSETKFKKLIARITAAKEMMDRSVDEEERKTIRQLEEFKTSMKNQAERLRVVSDLATLVEKMTANQSQLFELKSELIKYAELLSSQEIYGHNTQLKLTCINASFYEYSVDEDEMLNQFLPKKYVSLEKAAIENECLCDDFEGYIKQEFKEGRKQEVLNKWCNRLTLIDKNLYVCHGKSNIIEQFDSENSDKPCTSNQTMKAVVVKKANNGDVIMAGYEGLFLLGKDFMKSISIDTKLSIDNNIKELSSAAKASPAVKEEAHETIQQTPGKESSSVEEATDKTKHTMKQPDENTQKTPGNDSSSPSGEQSDKTKQQTKQTIEGEYCDLAVHRNKISALDFKECQVVTFEYKQVKGHKGHYEWQHDSTAKIPEKYKEKVFGNSNATLVVDKKDHMLICNKRTLLICSKDGKSSLKVISHDLPDTGYYMIVGIDSLGRLILCDFHTGNLYGILDTDNFKPSNMPLYHLHENIMPKHICDLIIDCNDNLWALYGTKGEYFIQKYEVMKPIPATGTRGTAAKS